MNITSILSLIQVASGVGGVVGFRHIIENAEQEVLHMNSLVSPSKYAVPRLNTAPPGGGVNVMIGKMPWRKKARLLPIMMQVIDSVAQCGLYMKDKTSPTQSQADETIWDALDSLARQHGAVEVGFTRISTHDIFKDDAIPYNNAIVFTIDMKKEAINTAPSYDALIEVLLTYAALGNLARLLTDYLRQQGYGAYPGFPIGGLVDYVRVAEQAGIGAIGYHGMLISPTEGTRQRINVVFTNMEIPESTTNQHKWVLDFCDMCRKCVRSCPPQAIFTTGQVNPITGRKPTVHYEKCVDYYGKNEGCAVCIKVCPFSQAGYEKIRRGFLKAQMKMHA